MNGYIGKSKKGVGKRKRKRTGLGKIVGTLSVLFVLSFCVWLGMGGKGILAAGDFGYTIDGTSKPIVTEYTMEENSVDVFLKDTAIYDDPTTYKIQWTSGDNNVIRFTEKLSGAGQPLTGTVTAVSAGTTNLTLLITRVDSGAQVGIFACKFTVGFAIKMTGNETVNEDVKRSIVMNNSNAVGGAAVSKKVELLYSSPGTVWKIENQDVAALAAGPGGAESDTVTTDRNSGDGSAYLIPKHTGKTKLTASFVDKNGKDHGSYSVDVYVRPAISKTNGNFTDATNLNWVCNNKDNIYVDVSFEHNPNALLSQKAAWVITHYPDFGRDPVFLKDSLGNRSTTAPKEDVDAIDLITDEAKDGKYRLEGKAGMYQILFFTAGSYTKPYETTAGKYNACLPVIVNVTLKSNLRDASESLSLGDTLDLAEYLNLTDSFINKYLNISLDSTDVVSNVGDTNRLNAVNTGNATVTISLRDPNREDLKQLLPDPTRTSYTLRIEVINALKLNITSKTAYVGEIINLVADLTPYANATYDWKVNDPKYLTIDSSQNTAKINVRAKTEENRKAIITVTCTPKDGVKRIATCELIIKDSVESIKMTPEELTMLEGKVEVIKTDATGSVPFKWFSSDEKVVKVDPLAGNTAATITAVKSGSAIITVLNEQNSARATCKITVVGEITDLKFEKTSMTVSLSQQYVTLKPIFTPANASGAELLWESKDPTIAKVDSNGLVTLLKSGTVRIGATVKTNKLIGAYCDITIDEKSTGFNFTSKSITIDAGKKEKLQWTLTPTDAKTDIVFTSLDPHYASVTSEGEVTGVSGGQTHIIASTSEGYTDICKVTVIQGASNVTLSTYDVQVAVGETVKVDAKAVPASSSETTFTWTPKDPAIATVTNDGKVTGVSAGSTIILVKTRSGKVEYLYVTVHDNLKGLSLDSAAKTITKGKSFTLKPIFSPATATNKDVKWLSTDPQVATVSSAGVVKGVNGGMTVITCTSVDGGYVAFCVVKVDEKITGIELDKSSATMGVGKKLTLKATLNSNYATTQKLRWTSSNTSVATVNQSGQITAKKIGKTVIRCAATDGSGSSATCNISVVRLVSSVKLNKTTIRMLEDRTTKIKATVSPSNASVKGVTWSTSDETIANIDSSGTIMAIKEGQCKITAKARDGSGKTATCWVYVTAAVPATGITISQKDMVMVNGTSEMISASIQPSNTTDGLRYSSDSKSIASVTSQGRVTARKPGVATITVTASSGKQATVTVTVVGLNKTSITMRQYEVETIWVEEVASGVRWQSENNSIATVDQAGKIICRKPGTTYITATIRGIKLQCRVVVTRL